MIVKENVLAIVLGGGKGTRLFPLTEQRCKPAISFGGKYRLIDIPISNCLNSGINKIYILTQYLTASIHKHIYQTYRMDYFNQGFIEVLAAEQTLENDAWYQGTADAVRQCLGSIKRRDVSDVVILSGDQLCSMNLTDMLNQHQEQGADLTIIGNPVSEQDVSRMGIIDADIRGEVRQLIEKPQDVSLVQGLKNDNQEYIASTGNYIFKKKFLVDILTENDAKDFGKKIIPYAIERGKVMMNVFSGYWEDIGTIESFFYANLGLADPIPAFNFYDKNARIFTHPRFLPATKIQNSMIKDSLISEGSLIQDADIHRSVIGIRSVIGSGTHIEKCIIMGNDYYEFSVDGVTSSPHIGHNVHLEGAIIDKNVVIEDDVKIKGLISKTKNYDHEDYCIRDGIIVVKKGATIPAGTIIE